MISRINLQNSANKLFLLSEEKKVTKTIFYLMKELNVSYKDVMDMPIPAFMFLVQHLKENSEEEKRSMKRKR